MQVDSVIRALIDRSPMSGRAVSRAMGKADTWARNSSRPGRNPKLGTVARVADLAGVDVVLVDRETGERLGVVDPPPRED